jgi:hypothetical protein
MTKIFILTAVLLYTCCLHAQPPDHILTGIVIDSANGTPLEGISVFLNNTTQGTVTGPEGDFRLEIPRGDYQLIVSAIGYGTAVIEVNGAHLSGGIRIALQTKATELAAVTVEPYDQHGWAKWGKFFMDNFIGAGENAGECKLENRSALRFFFSKKSNLLSVTATEPLQIENKALGYTLIYQLEGFRADFNNNYIRYFGYPYFRQMVAKRADRRKLWDFNRKMAYAGSIMHFMRSLYSGQSVTQGFLMEKEVSGPNREKERIKQIYRPDFQKPGNFPMDTLYYFWKVLRQPDHISWKVVVPPDSILAVAPDGTRDMSFTGPIIVLHGVREKAGGEFEESGLQMISAEPVKVEENGSYYPPQVLVTRGHWAQSEKICNLLPIDYGLNPN